MTFEGFLALASTRIGGSKMYRMKLFVALAAAAAFASVAVVAAVAAVAGGAATVGMKVAIAK